MTNAFIAFSNSKGVIKSVSVACNGEIDVLGVELLEYYKDLADVKDLVITSIDYIESGEAQYLDDPEDEDSYEFEEFDSKQDFIDEMWNCNYYLYEKNIWYIRKAGSDEFLELETVLEEEY